jgi:hypothetical protein
MCCLFTTTSAKSGIKYGNVNDQVEFAAQQLAAIPELADGFDAMGLSQGILHCLS